LYPEPAVNKTEIISSLCWGRNDEQADLLVSQASRLPATVRRLRRRAVMVSFARLSSARNPPPATALPSIPPAPTWLVAAVVQPPSPARSLPAALLRPTDPASAPQKHDLHRVILELGPEATAPANMPDLRAVLAPLGRPCESAVARALLMMAASFAPLPRSSGFSSALAPGESSAEPPTVFQMFRLFASRDASAPAVPPNSMQAVDAADWNPDSFVRVVNDLSASRPLDWEAVVRGFDTVDLPSILTPNAFRILAQAYSVATGASRPMLPAGPLVSSGDGRWTHPAAQLALLTCALTSPGSVNWESIKPAVEAPPADAASPFRCVPLIEALIHLNARPLLQAAVTASPDLVLLALAVSKPHTNAPLRQQVLVSLLASRLSVYPTSTPVAKRVWNDDRAAFDAALVTLWRNDRAALVCEIVHDLVVLRDVLAADTLLPPDVCIDIAVRSYASASAVQFNFGAWFAERCSGDNNGTSLAPPFAVAAMTYLSEAASSTGSAQAKAFPLEAVAIILKTLSTLPSSSAGDFGAEMRRVHSAYARLNPRLADLESQTWDSSSKSQTVGGASALGVCAPGPSQGAGSTPLGESSVAPSFAPAVEDEADTIFKNLYMEKLSVEQAVDLLRQLHTSPMPHNQQVYSCVVHTLFDEFRFLKKYPDRELRITGTLFGALAEYSVVSGSDLASLLNHILRALESIEAAPVPVGRLAKFGICALERCLQRLPEFPSYCRRVLSVPRLIDVVPELIGDVQSVLSRAKSTRGMEPSASEVSIAAPWLAANCAISSIVPESDVAGDGNSAPSSKSGVASRGAASNLLSGTTSSSAAVNIRQAQSSQSVSETVGALIASPQLSMSAMTTPVRAGSSAATLRASVSSGEGGFGFAPGNIDTLLAAQQHTMEVPNADTQDKIHFIFNNLASGNMEAKEKELMAFFEPRHVDFLAHYVVVKRASIEHNYHDLYIKFLTRVAAHIPNLFSKVLDRSHDNVRILLNSEKIVSSSSERQLLKSLGSWIGALTLGRNKALLRRDLDIKELLLDAYSNGRLIAVVPFVSKVLITAKDSTIFTPHNPWLVAILRLLKEIYVVPDLKLNVKFELPLMTKALGIEANDIEASELLKLRPAPVRDGNPDFTAIKKQAGMASPVRLSSPDSSPTRLVRSEDFVPSSTLAGAGVSANGSAISANQSVGVPIFSLGSMLTSSSPAVNGVVRASVPGSDAVSDLASIMASASLVSSGGQHQHQQQHRTGGPGGSGGASGSAATAAAVAAAAAEAVHQATAVAVAAAHPEQTIIPNLCQHITIDQSLVLFQSSPHLKRFIPMAMDRAVREIIQPVVERSCAIATITTRELALKDFSEESDAGKIQRAAKQMVQQLAGSLALVTCKEPLRVSMGNQLRPLLSSAVAGDQNLLEHTVQVLCTSNLEVGCAIIERAATEKAARDINDVIAPVFNVRRQPSSQQPRFMNGANARDVLRVYDDFARLPRAAAAPPPIGPALGVTQTPSSAQSRLPPQQQQQHLKQQHQLQQVHQQQQQASSGTSSLSMQTQTTYPGLDAAVPSSSVDQGGGSIPPLSAQVAPAIGARSTDAVLMPVGSNLFCANGASLATSVPVASMASPAAMAEAMRLAAAHAPTLPSAQSSTSSSLAALAGEEKLSTQQVLERFNMVYPQLTAAIVRTAGPGAQDISLVDLPLEHEVQQGRVQIAQAVKRSVTADEASMAVAQKVFKRMYEGETNLHREVHVALLESMRESSRRLSKELVSWLAYSEDAKKLNRKCIVALLRPGTLLHITSYDELVAKTCDSGRNTAALDFAAFLVRRAIIEEPLTTTRELYLTLEVLTKVGRRTGGPSLPSAPEGLLALVEASRKVVHRPAPSSTSSVPSTANTMSSGAPGIGSAGFAGGAAGPGIVGGGVGSGPVPDGHITAAAKALKASQEAETQDPPGSRETVASVLTEWQRVLASASHARPVPEHVIASFVSQAKPTTLYNEESRDRFLRLGIDLVCSATSSALKTRARTEVSSASPIANAPYTPVEAMVRLVASLCKTETSGESAAKGVSMLTAFLNALARCIVKATHSGDVRPHFRLFSGIVTELSIGMPTVDTGEASANAALDQEGISASLQSTSPVEAGRNGNHVLRNGDEIPAESGGRGQERFESKCLKGVGTTGGVENLVGTGNFQVLTAISHALNACNPHLAPSFSFAWLQLVSNRDVMPRLIAYRSGKGWQLFRQLLVSMLSFLSPHLGRVVPGSEFSDSIRMLYRGTLRVLLVLLHDFPEFLSDYHFALCDVIPPSCIQMRNLVLSAYPRTMRLPDPFMPNLKVDKLSEMASEPRVLSNLTTALVSAGVKGVVDKYLQDAHLQSSCLQSAAELGLAAKLLSKDSNARRKLYNIPAVNALVLYLGQHSISKSAPGTPPVINGPSTDILQGLISELDAEGRYHLFNGIANQLRYPNNHTHYFSCLLLFLFRDSASEEMKEQITRVLVERLIANRPHPWGLLITFIELIKNPTYEFWNHEFVRCAPQIARLFENVARFCGGGTNPASAPAAVGTTGSAAGRASTKLPLASA
jgi:CCR4-Not complex component, Not1/CCR4-NOT transcription complex subunit 1 CAF1-binding domain/Domain of unknown function (DUF3819)/CCR4-NOT transcription complex subunit 1 TTP binding domain